MNEPIEPLSFFDMARAAHVKRWHIINTVRQQTMAEHCFMVTLLTMQIMDQIQFRVVDPIEFMRVVIGALTHDLAEAKTGDIPTPGKRLINEAAGRDLIGDIEGMLLPLVPFVGGNVPTYAIYIIKLADLIADYHFLTDNAAGPYALAIREQLYARVIAQTELCTKLMPEYQWANVVGDIIQELVDYTYKKEM